MPLAADFAAKLHEQIALTIALTALVPDDGWDWHPDLPSGAASLPPLPLAAVLDHLQQSLTGIAATIFCLDRDVHAPLLELRGFSQPPLPRDAATWRTRFAAFDIALAHALAQVSNEALEQLVPTVFRPEGESAMTLLLGNFEHYVNHKYQLFFYLKLLGLPVGTADLYQFR